VLADGRLTDEQFVGSLSETQECSHTSENFQSCIYHCMFLCYFKNPRQYDAECSKSPAKIMQMSAMKICFQIAECSKSSAKITKF
jgi:hypothetical protein